MFIYLPEQRRTQQNIVNDKTKNLKKIKKNNKKYNELKYK